MDLKGAVMTTIKPVPRAVWAEARQLKTNVIKMRVPMFLYLFRLKLYTRVPPNGLVVYCGTIVTEEGKEKKVNIDFEPFKPINTSLYLCDNKFHTEALTALLADDNRFGFIVMDGNGALFGTLQGNTRCVILRFLAAG